MAQILNNFNKMFYANLRISATDEVYSMDKGDECGKNSSRDQNMEVRLIEYLEKSFLTSKKKNDGCVHNMHI